MSPLNDVTQPTSQDAKTPARAVAKAWLVPSGLLVPSAIPLSAGAIRLMELTGGAAITPANARFCASPLPVVLHILAAAAYIVLGAFQLVPGFRRRMPS